MTVSRVAGHSSANTNVNMDAVAITLIPENNVNLVTNQTTGVTKNANNPNDFGGGP